MLDDSDTPSGVDTEADAPRELPVVEAEPNEAETPQNDTADEVASEEDGDPEGDDSEEDKPKRRSRAQRERIRRENLIRQNAELSTRLRMLEERSQAPEPKAKDGPPQEGDFEDFFAYQRALARYEVRQELMPQIEGARQSAQEIRRQEAFDASRRAHDARIAAFAKSTPDFKDVIETAEVDLPENSAAYKVASRLVVESDLGPQIIYHLAKNPDLTERLGRLDEISAARELGKLEAKLTPSKPRTETGAPPPVKTLKGNVQVTKDPETMSMADYVKWRNAGGGK